MIDLDHYLGLLSDLRNRLKSDDPKVRGAAENEYERCARAPNFAAAVLGHVATAQSVLKSGERLNSWETDFAKSLVYVRHPSRKQLEKLAAIFVKAHATPIRPKPTLPGPERRVAR